MKGFVFVFLALTTFSINAQFADEFSDGDFTNDPAWSGDESEFVVVDTKLQSNGPAESSELYLSTPSVAIEDASWSFLIELGFAPSSSNKVKVYLVADSEDLESSLNGYYLEIGQSGDDQLKFYRQDEANDELLFTGSTLFTGNINVRINITRDSNGQWEVFSDPSGGSTLSSEGGAFVDNTYTSTSFFGVVCIHTSTRNDLFLFDDFVVTGTAETDKTAPTVQSTEAISSNAIEIVFSEDLNQTTVENSDNYVINEGVSIIDATLTSPNTLQLTTSELTNGQDYIVTISNLEDESGNAIAPNSTVNFSYLVVSEPEFREVVINEIFSNQGDDNPISNDYIELYNATGDKFFDLKDWTIEDNNKSPKSLESFILRPNEYLIISSDTSEFSNESDRLEISLDNFNNNSDHVVLRFTDVEVVDSVGYGITEDGISIEQINPDIPFFLESNYANSIDPLGGTPGSMNSLFDDTPDVSPPYILSILIISSNELAISFSEIVDEVSSESIENYLIDGGISVEGAQRDSEDKSLIHLQVSTLISGETRTISIDGVEDLFGNAISSVNEDFTYIKTDEAIAFDVVINEFLASPNGESELPNAEYVELFNKSEKFIDLSDWTIADVSSISNEFPNFILYPNEYVILSRDGESEAFSSFGAVLEVSSFPTLNNSGDSIIIRNGIQEIIHDIRYTSSSSGISTELINPNGPDYSAYNYSLSIDSAGGTPGSQNSVFDDSPDTTPPEILGVTVVSETRLLLAFSEPLNENIVESPLNYSLADGVVVSALLTELLKAELTVEGLIANQANEITIENLQDLSGNVMSSKTLTFTYFETEPAFPGDIIINEFLSDPFDNNDDFVELFNRSDKFISLEGWTISDESSTSPPFEDIVLTPGSYLIIYDEDATTDYSTFGDVITIPSLTLNNDNDLIEIKNDVGNRIAYVEYGTITKEAVSLELVNPNDPCISFSSYQFSSDASGYTSGRINSVFDDTSDIAPPTVMSYGYDNALIIHFSEVMDVASLTEPGNYAINNLTIEEILVEGNFPAYVEIRFMEEIVSGEVYNFILNGLTDCVGNVMESTSISFGFGRSPLFNELIITEILFDEDPAIGLPEREYFEIFNASQDVISTAGLLLTDATNTTDFPIVNLTSGEYYVVTSTSGVSAFDNAIGLSGFPSLNNSGELLVLSLGDTPISSIAYDPDWHGEEKAAGGYSLELVDITNPCLESPANWRSSVDISGGTPGRSNSVSEILPDNLGPEVLAIAAISSDTIRFDFSEKVDPLSISTSQFSFQPLLIVDDVSMNLKEPNALFVKIGGTLDSNLPYSVDLSGIFDCAGNEVKPTDLMFALPLQAQQDEVKLSEVLFNPRANGVDFVEIYNDSENYIDLKGWQLARITDEGVDDEKIISTEQLVIDPTEYLVFTTDANALLTNYPKGLLTQFVGMPSLPTYPNDTGNVVLLNAAGEVMERFFYDQDYHYDLLESVNGVSLERISFSNPTSNPSNWRSASSTAGLATPGYANSQSTSIESTIAKVEVTPKVFIPGNAGSGRDYTTINYQFTAPGQFANVNIYDQNGRLVRNLTQGELLATSGFLRWDGETNSGSMARLGYYVVLFEVYDANGNTEIIKKTVAVGRGF